MKKYYLMPIWEIIADESGLILQSLCNDTKIRLENSPHHPPLIQLFNHLKKGVTLSELKNNELLPKERLESLISYLKKLELVEYLSIENHPIETTSYLELLDNQLVGPGKIISEYHPILVKSDNPLSHQLFISKATLFDPRFILHQPILNEGWGADENPGLASIKAIVEGVERYSLANYETSDLQRLTWEEAKSHSLSPTQLSTSEKKLKMAGRIEWCGFDSINADKKILVPLDFCHHPVDYTSLNRLPVCPMNISGVAAHQSRDAATLNALLELCEHEALMVAWFGRRTTPTIDPGTLKPIHQDYISSLNKMGWQITLKDISLDLAPVVMAVAIGPLGKRALTIGSCAAFSTQYAIGKALSEVMRTIIYDEITIPIFSKVNTEKVNDTLSHSDYYASHQHLPSAAHLWEGGTTISANNNLTHGEHRGKSLDEVSALWHELARPEQKELDYLLNDILLPVSLEPFVKDITSKDIKKSNIPLFVVKTLVPEMARFVVGYNQKPAKTSRFKKLLKRFGVAKPVDYQSSIHPFS